MFLAHELGLFEERWSLLAVCWFNPCDVSGDCVVLVVDLVQKLKAFSKENKDP